MNGKRQKTTTCGLQEEGEAQALKHRGTEPFVTKNQSSSQVNNEQLMEEIVNAENVKSALKRVERNKGAPGMDGMQTSELRTYLKEHWPAIRTELLKGTYVPQPLKRVEIPKADGKGIRKLSIPTCLDRFIQQAVHQVLQKLWEPTFSESSYGFRPGRSAHQAVGAAQSFIIEGNDFVVDIDLANFFDRVNHDRLMSRVADRVHDRRLLKLIRRYLTAGVLVDGLLKSVDEGTPQGGPLSPLLSNIVLDELDKELEQRGLLFCRYGDDCNIYVRSRRAANRVMISITRFIENKLKLKVNAQKSAAERPWNRTFLSFTFLRTRQGIKRMLAKKAIRRFKKKVRYLTRRNRGVNLEAVFRDLRQYLRGWGNYFGYCQIKSSLSELDGWIRRRLRSLLWRQWKTPRNRFKQLRKRGLSSKHAAQGAGSNKGPWRMSGSPPLNMALPIAFFNLLKLPQLSQLMKAS